MEKELNQNIKNQELSNDEKIEIIAEKILTRHLEAFKELAK